MDKRELEQLVHGGEALSKVSLAGTDLAGAALGGGNFEAVDFSGARLAAPT